jgi:hypothetical protein
MNIIEPKLYESTIMNQQFIYFKFITRNIKKMMNLEMSLMFDYENFSIAVEKNGSSRKINIIINNDLALTIVDHSKFAFVYDDCVVPIIKPHSRFLQCKNLSKKEYLDFTITKLNLIFSLN